MAQATTVTPLDHLVKVLKLGEPSAYRNHTYINGESMYFPTGRVYGGQVIAQSVIAASKTVGPSRLPHSVHGYFIAAGDIRQDLLFDVENLRDGRSFSARRVNVAQAEGSILTAIASFQETGQEGVEFADPMPENLPDPETLTSAKELMQPFAEKSPFANYYAEKSPFDIRHVTPTVMLRADKDSAEHDSGKQMVWMKADGHVDVPQVMHRAMLALGCDQVMMEPVLRRARVILRQLEEKRPVERTQAKKREESPQMAFISPREQKLVDLLSRIDMNNMTPIESLNRLYELVQIVRNE